MSKAESGHFKIKEVDGLEVLSLLDNSADFLSTPERKEVQHFREWTKKRYGREWTNAHSKLPFAEHGFSMLIRTMRAGESNSILFDTGGSSNGVIENAKRMGIDLSEVESIVLSHGHYDHFGGLLSSLNAISKDDLPLIVHEDMFKTRGVINVDGTMRVYPEFPRKREVSSANLILTKQPYLIANDRVLVTGEIPRETSFEKGYLQHRTIVNGSWQPDPWIWDDRAIIVNVKEKGLVVISGCAHAGIINTLNYAQRITLVANIYAVIGGFHLAGKEAETRIRESVEEIQLIHPTIIVAAHCTGWRAKCKMANTMPKKFIWNNVGNLYKL
jgi:7,8-dihydropterin-6-yl-methyl-4-(beta-D-ribofuranosyl)aminobenzene 5'-phosphate synthase